MRRRVVGSAMLAGSLALAGFAGAVSATSAVDTYSFFGCTGPGVPSSFDAVKTATPDNSAHGISAAASFRVVGSNDTYTVYDFGFGANHGHTVNAIPADWCWVTYSNEGTVLAGGDYHGG